jgi:hypothetical protein
MAEDTSQNTGQPAIMAAEQSAEHTEREKTPRRVPSGQRDTVFYYNRERRLEKASPAVRELYEAAPVKRQGLFKTLVATKSRAFLFASIVLMVVVRLIFTYIVPNDTPVLGGNTISASAQVFQGNTFIVVRKGVPAKKDMNAYTGVVDLAVTIPVKSDAAEQPRFSERIFFTLQPEEDFRVSVPFTAAELLLILQAGDEQMTVRLRPE